MTPGFNLLSYDHYIVSFSGGKDSLCLLLWLFDNGVPKEKIELWHQLIDGRGDSFFDWPVTEDYCRKVAEALGVPIYFQWKEGGFRREMLRQDSLTAPTCFELPDETAGCAGGKKGKVGTRLKFPQCSPNLSVRWCSAYLKIMVCSTALINQKRFRGKRTLLLTGERGEESPQRARYNIFEPHAADLRAGKKYTRHIDHLRPIRDWTERQVWELIELYRVRVHPCYYMGWSRCSCAWCVFGNKDQFASAAFLNRGQAETLICYERHFQYTLKRNADLGSFIASGTPYAHITDELAVLAMGTEYKLPVIIPGSEAWILPAGAYGEGGGPS